jgi:hypothetical protein
MLAAFCQLFLPAASDMLSVMVLRSGEHDSTRLPVRFCCHDSASVYGDSLLNNRAGFGQVYGDSLLNNQEEQHYARPGSGGYGIGRVAALS